MNIKGKITWVSDVQSFETRDRRMIQKRCAVVETLERYPQSLCFDVTGDDVQNQFLDVGQRVEVDYNMHAVEWHGRYFNQARAWKIVLWNPE